MCTLCKNIGGYLEREPAVQVNTGGEGEVRKDGSGRTQRCDLRYGG